MLNKRAKVYFIVIMALIFMTVILPAAWFISYKKETKFNKLIGESQLLLLKTYEKGESVLYYIDRSAELSFRQILHEYSTNAGVDAGCECNDGYCLWNKEGEDCWPSEVKEKIADELNDKLKEYFDSYPEKIPEIEYKIDGKDNSTTGKTEKRLRMDITEKNIYNFAVVDAFSTSQEEEEEKQEEEPPVEEEDYPTTGGKCKALADYAAEYVKNRCKYSYPAAPLATPYTCNQYGLTCATFVSSVTAYKLGQATGGNGNQQCYSSTVTRIGKDPRALQPGDVFSSEVCYSGSCTAYGHTGMYVGRGYLVAESKGEGNFCWRRYIPNPKGDYIFAHSIGYAGSTLPGVCYDTYSHLFINSIFKLTSFCRPNRCM